MNQGEMFKIIGIIIVSFFIIYITMKIFHSQTNIFEGFKKGKNKGAKASAEAARREAEQNDSSFEDTNSSDDINTIESTAASIKAQLIKLQDYLSLSKNKQNYEDIIIDLDDLTSCGMLLMISNITPLNMEMVIERINHLKGFKDSLNVAMAFLDKQ